MLNAAPRILAALPVGSMAIRGAFHPTPDDAVPNLPDGAPVGTLVLLGWTGGWHWPAFRRSAEFADGQRHPLDRWSRRLLDDAAATLDAAAFYPFGGPPHHDFQRWALRAEAVSRSPIGLLIHPQWGLWHAYRGALGLRAHLVLPAIEPVASPCIACVDKPCLTACPVGAFTAGGYDTNSCSGYLQQPQGASCLTGSCGSRRACPVVPDPPYAQDQHAFHMRAFARTMLAR